MHSEDREYLNHTYTDSERRWNTKTSGSGSIAEDANQSLIDLNLTTSAGDEIIRETDRVFSYQPGKSLLIMNTFTMNEAKTGLRQRVGYFGKQNGIFLELDGEDLYIVKRSFSTGSIVETRVHQSQWGVDKLDGSGTSRQILDITQSQIFWMDVEWLGVGSVRCGFVYQMWVCDQWSVYSHTHFPSCQQYYWHIYDDSVSTNQI